jgi:hypothetical protein
MIMIILMSQTIRGHVYDWVQELLSRVVLVALDPVLDRCRMQNEASWIMHPGQSIPSIFLSCISVGGLWRPGPISVFSLSHTTYVDGDRTLSFPASSNHCGVFCILVDLGGLGYTYVGQPLP